jgi:hypothetical protein
MSEIIEIQDHDKIDQKLSNSTFPFQLAIYNLGLIIWQVGQY